MLQELLLSLSKHLPSVIQMLLFHDRLKVHPFHSVRHPEQEQEEQVIHKRLQTQQEG